MFENTFCSEDSAAGADVDSVELCDCDTVSFLEII